MTTDADGTMRHHYPLRGRLAIGMIFPLLALLLPLGSAGADTNPTALRLLEKARESLYSSPKEASRLAGNAIRLSDLSDPDSVCREATILYGEAEQLLGNFDLSIRTLHDAEALVDSSDMATRARLYALQGRVFGKLGDFSRSSELNDKATSIFRALGDSTSVAWCYNERGVMLLNTDQYVVAEHLFRRALDINRRQHNLEGIARNLNNMCLYRGDSEEKLAMIDEAITINKNLDSKWSLGENFNNKGRQLCYAGRPQEALQALDEAYKYISQIEARELLCDYYEYMALAYSQIGNYKKAHDYLWNMTVLVRDLQRRNNQRNAEMELSYKRIVDQRRAIERQESDYRIKLLHRNIWILIAVVVLGGVSGLFYYKWYRHGKNLQLLETRHELDQKDKELDSLKLRQKQLELENTRNMLSASHRELTGFAAFLKSRNEMMTRIREMLREGYKMDPSAIVPHLKKINAFISTYASNDKTSQTLLLKAEERNKDFMQHLLERHPALTKGERNLALLIRGGMSSKEISMLLGLEPKTVNMNRYRLRKALDLDAETDLYEYLQRL